MAVNLSGSDTSFSVERFFTLEDQHWFAGLSGDYNPIHIDEFVAYRAQYPQPLVHGIHVVLWCLHYISQTTSELVLSKLSVRFHLPVFVNQKIKLEIKQLKQNTWKATVYSDQGKLVTMSVTSSDFNKTNIQQQKNIPFSLPNELQVNEQLKKLSGRVTLRVNRRSLEKTFVELMAKCCQVQVATLLTCSYIVGMRVPGLHSLFNELKLCWTDPDAVGDSQNRHLSFEVCRVLPSYRRITLELEGRNCTGNIEATFRPKPVKQETLSYFENIVASDAMKNDRVLIIGGSRGIGNVASKIAAAAGAEVWFTYSKSHEEARLLLEELSVVCYDPKALRMNVLDSCSAFFETVIDFRPTIILYFATPPIKENWGEFNSHLLLDFNKYYIDAFEKIIRKLHGAIHLNFDVILASSEYVNDKPEQFREYVASKSAAESLAFSLDQELKHATFHVYRFPKVLTDQTSGSLNSNLETPGFHVIKALGLVRDIGL